MDFEKPAQKLGLELEEYMELVQLFFETGTNDLKGLEDALVKNDTQVVMERAHSLKGASGNLGFNEIFEIARGIENKAIDNNIKDIDNAVMQIKQYFDEIGTLLEKRV